MKEKTIKNMPAVVKMFMAIFLPLSVLIVSFTMWLTYRWDKDEKDTIGYSDFHDLSLQKEKVTKDFHLIISDLIFLSRHAEISKILADPNAIQELSEELLVFCKSKMIYSKVSFLNNLGMELIRINYNSGNPVLVPQEQLQFKSQRYYFKKISQLEKGEVYVSPFDLSMAKGEIEQPIKPVIRFGTPFFDKRGSKKGILVLSYLGEKLLNNLITPSAGYQDGRQTILLNSEGYRLCGSISEDKWGFMYENRKGKTFGKTFPDAWEKISKTKSGQFYDSDGSLFTFDTTYPLIEAWKLSEGTGKNFYQRIEQFKSYYWKIVYRTTPEVINAKVHGYMYTGAVISGISAVLLAIISWFLAVAGVKRKQAEERLAEHQQHLEKLVKERTTELTETNEHLRQEITERKQVESALRKERNKIQKYLDVVGVILIVLNTDGTVSLINKKGCEVLGYKEEDIIAKDWFDNFLPEKIRNKIKNIFIQSMAGKVELFEYFENPILTENGQERIILWHNTVLKNEEGKIIAALSSGEDITNRKQAEEKLKTSQEELRNLSAHLQLGIEKERTRIAREIHDELGQILTSLKLYLSSLIKKLPQNEKGLFEKTETMSELIDTCIKTVQKITEDLRPSLLDNIGLIPAMEWHAKEFQKHTGIKCVFTVKPFDMEEMALDKDRTTVIFRIFQETLTNIARHSKATTANTTLEKKNYSIILIIKDNGKGITEEDLFSPKSFGIIGLRERANFVGGEVMIKGIKGKGTTVTVTIPFFRRKKTNDKNTDC